MTASQSSAHVPLPRPERYAKQLVSHLGRHGDGDWSADDGHGWITFVFGRVDLATTSEELEVTVHGQAADLDRLEDVVGRHLTRFVGDDQLTLDWHRPG